MMSDVKYPWCTFEFSLDSLLVFGNLPRCYQGMASNVSQIVVVLLNSVNASCE